MLQFYLTLVQTDEDRDKLTRIYEKNYGTMMFVAESLLGDKRADAQDMVHNAMLKIIDKFDSLDFSDDLRTRNLCVTIVRNRCFDYLRSKDEKSVPLNEQNINVFDFQVDEIVLSEENVCRITKAIESLDEKYVGLCMLKFVHGYSEKEISELLEINYNTVRSRIERARKKLYYVLKEDTK